MSRPKLSVESLLPIGVIALIVGVIGLGAWVMFGSDISSRHSEGTPEESRDSSPFDSAQGQNDNGFVAGATYQQPEENFTFNYPEKFQAREEEIGNGGRKIVVEGSEPKKGFEITILPFDEEGELTPDRIRADIPNIVMENIRTVTVSDLSPNPSPGLGRVAEGRERSNIPALAFNSTDQTIGRTFEIWFTHEGYLYQALTYPEFAREMEEILKTWRFKPR